MKTCFRFHEYFHSRSILSLEQAGALTTTLFDQVKSSLKPKAQQTFEDRRKQLKITVDTTHQELQTLTVRYRCSNYFAPKMTFWHVCGQL